VLLLGLLVAVVLLLGLPKRCCCASVRAAGCCCASVRAAVGIPKQIPTNKGKQLWITCGQPTKTALWAPKTAIRKKTFRNGCPPIGFGLYYKCVVQNNAKRSLKIETGRNANHPRVGMLAATGTVYGRPVASSCKQSLLLSE